MSKKQVSASELLGEENKKSVGIEALGDENKKQVGIGQIVYYIANGDNEFTVHPSMVIGVYPNGSAKLDVFMPGFLSMIDKVPEAPKDEMKAGTFTCVPKN